MRARILTIFLLLVAVMVVAAHWLAAVWLGAAGVLLALLGSLVGG